MSWAALGRGPQGEELKLAVQSHMLELGTSPSAPVRPSDDGNLMEDINQIHPAKQLQIPHPHKLCSIINVRVFKLLTCGVICSNTEDFNSISNVLILRE